MFLILPENEEGLTELLPILGANKRTSPESWGVMAAALREEAGSAQSRRWSLFALPPPDDERLAMISEAVVEQLSQEGKAVLDLQVRMVTVPELQAVAAGLGLSIGLVAVLKSKGGELPPLLESSDRELMAAIAALGGTVSTGQVAGHLGKRPVPIRKRLQVLVRFGRLKQTGRKGGARYSIPG